MRFTVALVFALLFVGPPSAKRNRATTQHGSTKTTARVRGAGTDVTVRDGKLSVTLHVGEKCHAEMLAETIGKEVRQNPDAFGAGRGITTEFWAVGDPIRSRGSKKGKPCKKGSSGGTSSLAGFESAFADVLATGRHGKGRGGEGQTCFNGLNLNLGALVAANALPVPADASFSNGPNGTKTATSQQGGITTTWTKNAGHLTVASSGAASSLSSDAYTSGTSVTFTTKSTGSALIGHELTHVVQQGAGQTSTTHVDFKPDGSTKTEQTKSGTSGGVEVKVKNTETHDQNGNKTGGKTEVEVNGKKTAEQEHDTSGDEKSGGKKKASGGTGPTLTPEGSFSMPPMCIPDAMVGAIINWNRLGEAVTYPSPIEDGEDAPDGKGGIGKVNKLGPCGSTDESSFDPDPAYLRPNEQGWVSDPVPFLRGGAQSARGGSKPSR